MGATAYWKGIRECLSSRKSNESVGLAPVLFIRSVDAFRRFPMVGSYVL